MMDWVFRRLMLAIGSLLDDVAQARRLENVSGLRFDPVA
jgi:hypothetical protein